MFSHFVVFINKITINTYQSQLTYYKLYIYWPKKELKSVTVLPPWKTRTLTDLEIAVLLPAHYAYWRSTRFIERHWSILSLNFLHLHPSGLYNFFPRFSGHSIGFILTTQWHLVVIFRNPSSGTSACFLMKQLTSLLLPNTIQTLPTSIAVVSYHCCMKWNQRSHDSALTVIPAENTTFLCLQQISPPPLLCSNHILNKSFQLGSNFSEPCIPSKNPSKKKNYINKKKYYLNYSRANLALAY